MECLKFSIFGAVQGVGFRPFIYVLCTKLGLKGEVYNDSEGVKLFLGGSKEQILEFEKRLFVELPPLARIDKIEKIKIENQNFTEFKITSSKQTSKFTPILPDFAICDECRAEFYNKANERFHYPFINCTNCGPRISIISELPYDRKNTTMAKFKMCKLCKSEYENPLNRRYHAQPISCPNCGPKLFFKDKFGNLLSGDAIKNCIDALKNGKIVAIKGLGGFHLVCDALNNEAISLLRERKHRPKKPFAIMCKDSKIASEFAIISNDEKMLLESNVKPIVILKLKNNGKIPPNLAPSLDKIGIFLPPTALHLLIFEYFKNPLIATSANLSGEPIIYNEQILLKKLGSVIDYYLDNDREILTPSDDSIAVVVDKKPMFFRTSRGLNPKIYLSNFKQKGTFLSVGSELKNQFCIYKDGQIFISPYLGDLKNVATFERFKSVLAMFAKNYELKFDAVISDLHPNFLHTKYFENQGFIVQKVQHHYAHLLSALDENKLLGQDRKFLGFCFDGTGYGEDGRIWGGEVFKFDEFGYERVAHFDEFLLLGGESSIKNIDQLAFSILKKYDIQNEQFLGKFSQTRLKNLETLYKKELNSFYSSSLGRIFDAFCAVVCGLEKVSYDGEAGMMLEALYDNNIKNDYKFKLENKKIIYKEAFECALKDEPKVAATKFINGICKLLVEMAKKWNLPVVLSGGVFQNQTLLINLIDKFKEENIEFYINSQNPTNDSGIALGQMVWYLSNKNCV
ncbi:carbamoyltransferase HypF [Campylobacter geochelonis]|uniref:carbamoyltransferase HypF n=1 Tax=Campylobacter geochelonis TaxID=1780362 RepID=UPI0007708480|nr:carbamoyltransferase HypF [Campylobacter geochelonis]CZE48132.1 [NiFe] hydrogenase maturation protein HypF [Campylobacter geochelonis]